jgi:DNA-binding NarL/FixJ family response regulator
MMSVSKRLPRVRILSHQEVLTRGLTAMLAAHPDRAAITEDGDADVVLYDVFGMHVSDGADLDELVREASARILLVSRDLRPDLRARALARGAHGWISMSVDDRALIEAVEAVVAGENAPAQSDRLGREHGLTPREVEVLALVAQGLSNVEIAERLYVSINSVKTYIRSAYAKIGVASRTRAVIWAIQHGFPPSES